MSEILYSDIEVTAKVVMDPYSMRRAASDIRDLLNETHDHKPQVERLVQEMEQVLSRLEEMHIF